MNIHNGFGSALPYYTLNTNDQLVRLGNLVSGRPLLSIIYPVLGSSQLIKYFAVDIPKINADHLSLTTRIIAEARDTFKNKFQSDDFYVLLFPKDNPRIIPFLEQAGIKYLNYHDLFDPNEPGYRLPDGHPAAKAYIIIAEQLVKDLKLNDN